MALGHWLKDYIGPRGSASSGGGTEPLVLRHDRTEGNFDYYDKTWQEVADALTQNRLVIYKAYDSTLGDTVESSMGFVTTAGSDEDDQETYYYVYGGRYASRTDTSILALYADTNDGQLYARRSA